MQRNEQEKHFTYAEDVGHEQNWNHCAALVFDAVHVDGDHHHQDYNCNLAYDANHPIFESIVRNLMNLSL